MVVLFLCFSVSSDEDASGSEEEGSEEDSGEEEKDKPLRRKKLSLDERRQERAAGDHPLQQRFKELSRGLLKKHTGESIGGISS